MIRALQVVVVAFWLTMTVWMVRSTWFPDESRFVTVEISEVLEAMFVNWHETAEMVVLEDGRRVGQMSISASSTRPVEGVEFRPGRILSVTGALSEGLDIDGAETDSQAGAGAAAMRQDRLFWRGLLRLDEANQFAAGEVVLRFPEQNSRVKLGYSNEAKNLQTEVMFNGMPLFHYDGALAELEQTLKGAGGFGAGFSMLPGFALPGMELIKGELAEWLPAITEEGASPQQIAEGMKEKMPPITAKFGRTRIAGQRMAVYLLSIGDGNRDSTLKVYIGEDGRPLKVDTPLGYEIIAEVLAPQYWEQLSDPELSEDGTTSRQQ